MAKKSLEPSSKTEVICRVLHLVLKSSCCNCLQERKENSVVFKWLVGFLDVLTTYSPGNEITAWTLP